PRTVLHADPSQCSAVAWYVEVESFTPTSHASLPLAAVTPQGSVPTGLVTDVHAVPSQCSARGCSVYEGAGSSQSPTTQTSLDDRAVMPRTNWYSPGLGTLARDHADPFQCRNMSWSVEPSEAPVAQMSF